jgi:hypothetical protein
MCGKALQWVKALHLFSFVPSESRPRLTNMLQLGRLGEIPPQCYPDRNTDDQRCKTQIPPRKRESAPPQPRKRSGRETPLARLSPRRTDTHIRALMRPIHCRRTLGAAVQSLALPTHIAKRCGRGRMSGTPPTLRRWLRGTVPPASHRRMGAARTGADSAPLHNEPRAAGVRAGRE